MKRKVFVLGLDGATFDVLNPLMGEGVIPNIKDICATGASGPLRTIFPPVTAPAWLALATGLNPGKTGVFDYINRSSSDNETMAPISSAYYEGRAVWNYLNSKGYKTGIFNYPTLSPPPEVDGFSVTGMGRYKGAKLCFPDSLEKELHEITGGYENRLNLRSLRYKKNIMSFFEDLDRIITKQSAALKYLLREKEWDFFWGVFSFTDWMQHVLWKYIDKNHPLHDPQASLSVQKKYKDMWKRIDDVIGELLAILPDGTVFMIVSDHGAGPVDSVFYPNAWLRKKGWLKKKELGWKGFLAEHIKLFSAGSDNKYANKLLHLLKNKILNIKSSIDLIDIENSLAYSPEHNTMFGCIALTPKGKSVDGFKNQLIEEIQRLPRSIREIKTVQIYLPEEIYSGPYVDLSPDIFFIINNYQATVEVDLAKKTFLASPSIAMRTGGHLPDGVFMSKGNIVEHIKLAGISVLDVAPTALALFGTEIPYSMDGRVLIDCFKPGILQTMNFSGSHDDPLRLHETNAGENLEEMKDILKSLGYM